MSEKKPPEPSDAALKARLAQLELENRVRMQRHAPTVGDPSSATPRRGFGSAQGIAHLRSTEYERRGPTPPPPAAPIPEPGKARFGGTYLQTPLPGIIGPNAEPGKELIPPIPATPSSAAAPPPAAAKGGMAPFAGAASPVPLAGPTMGPPSAAMPGGRPLPPSTPPAAKPTPPAKIGPLTPAASLEPKGKVVGGGALGKAPLPAIYHAGLKSAQESKPADTPLPAVAKPTPAATSLSREAPIVIPEGVEVTKDAAQEAAKEQAKAARAKRFKNPTLGPKPTDP